MTDQSPMSTSTKWLIGIAASVLTMIIGAGVLWAGSQLSAVPVMAVEMRHLTESVKEMRSELKGQYTAEQAKNDFALLSKDIGAVSDRVSTLERWRQEQRGR